MHFIKVLNPDDQTPRFLNLAHVALVDSDVKDGETTKLYLLAVGFSKSFELTDRASIGRVLNHLNHLCETADTPV